MNSVEEFGKTVEEAKQKALQALGVSEAEAVVEVVDPGRPGSGVGWGTKFARVRVSRKGAAAATHAAPPAAAAAPPARASRIEPAIDVDEDEDEEEEAAPPRPAPRRAVRSEADVEKAESLIRDILEKMDVQADLVREPDREDGVRINIVGADLGFLIGKSGQTAEALQYLVNLILSRNAEGFERISIDIEGYRSRREKSLEDLAVRMARRVRTDGKSVTLEPMLPSERRVIHMALAEDPAVRTWSQGEEPMRKVVISPARRGR
ncbi:MAG: RNA-binding cell elongation regulator Jag/EloR [Candidatus Xenobia bacterium]